MFFCYLRSKCAKALNIRVCSCAKSSRAIVKAPPHWQVRSAVLLALGRGQTVQTMTLPVVLQHLGASYPQLVDFSWNEYSATLVSSLAPETRWLFTQTAVDSALHFGARIMGLYHHIVCTLSRVRSNIVC